MSDSVLNFYNNLSEDYHLIFKDWDSSVRWHSNVINKVIRKYKKEEGKDVSLLDCSCGIGTQAIGLALMGYKIHATDLSPKAVERAQIEALRLDAQMTFGVADFRTLDKQVNGIFDIVISCDNSLPHLLKEDELLSAIKNIRNKLTDGGLFLASIRDYDQLIIDRPCFMSQNVFDSEMERRIVFQVWDWQMNSNIYTVNQFIVKGNDDNWKTTKNSTLYRAIPKSELKCLLEKVGLSEVTWHMPDETGYYQPIITAIKL